jgi:hypothetical protein
MAVGAKHALADCLGFPTKSLLFTNEAVRHQLMGLPAMLALLGLQLHGLLVYRVQIGVVGLHGTGQDKRRYLGGFMTVTNRQAGGAPPAAWQGPSKKDGNEKQRHGLKICTRQIRVIATRDLYGDN